MSVSFLRKKKCYIRLIIAGTKDIRKDSATAGRKPLMTARITPGSFTIQCRKGTVEERYLILEAIPIRAQGRDQKIIIVAIADKVEKRRIIRDHHLIVKADQTIS